MSVVFGLATAVMFATSMLVASRAIRMIGNFSVLAWSAMIGLLITLPFTFATGVPEGLTGMNLVWLGVCGVGNVVGLLLSFQALQFGKVGVVAPIIATEGAIAAGISAAMGESIAPLAAFMLMFIVAGVVVSGIAKDPAPIEHERPVASVAFALASAACFGVSLFSIGHLSESLPIAWLLLPPRLVGVVFVAIPLIAMRRLELTKRVAPLVIASGVAEVIGFTCYSIGAEDSIAVTAVLSSQFATIGAVFAYLLFKERLGRLQITGVAMLVVGVAALSLALNVGSS